MAEETGADVALELGGQKVNVRNVKSLNTLATVATLILVILLGYVVWEHKNDDKDTKVALISTLKDLAVSQRVTNCLMATAQEQREAKLPVCERIAR